MSSFHDHGKPSNEEENFLLAMQLATGCVLPMTMKAAIELGLLEIMAKASPSQLSSAEIASQLPTKSQDSPIILDRILRLLASHSILTCNLVSNEDGHAHRLYGFTPVGKFFVPNEDGVSLASHLNMVQDKASIDCWYNLKDAVLEGVLPIMKAHNGLQGFEYVAEDRRFQNLFNLSMYNDTTLVMKRILEIYKGFEGLKELVDIGGGLGASLSLIISKYPEIKGINFDLPHVIKDASSSPGVEHVGGDMFVGVPRGQTIFMKWILHDWADDQCLKLLKNCYDSLPDSGKLIVVESIVPELSDTDLVTQNISNLDLCLSITFRGAKERTKEEFWTLAKGAGFSAMNAIVCAYCYWVIEFYKKM